MNPPYPVKPCQSCESAWILHLAYLLTKIFRTNTGQSDCSVRVSWSTKRQKFSALFGNRCLYRSAVIGFRFLLSAVKLLSCFCCQLFFNAQFKTASYFALGMLPSVEPETQRAAKLVQNHTGLRL
jgi:hypothetical protein